MLCPNIPPHMSRHFIDSTSSNHFTALHWMSNMSSFIFCTPLQQFSLSQAFSYVSHMILWLFLSQNINCQILNMCWKFVFALYKNVLLDWMEGLKSVRISRFFFTHCHLCDMLGKLLSLWELVCANVEQLAVVNIEVLKFKIRSLKYVEYFRSWYCINYVHISCIYIYIYMIYKFRHSQKLHKY
jgi:thiol-disulfide isomerase/thioredoxin